MLEKITMIKLEPHFCAAFSACESVCQILDLLPNSDLIEDVKVLIHTQHSLFIHMIEGKHFGSDAIEKFMKYTIAIRDEAIRLKEEQD